MWSLGTEKLVTDVSGQRGGVIVKGRITRKKNCQYYNTFLIKECAWDISGNRCLNRLHEVKLHLFDRSIAQGNGIYTRTLFIQIIT
jgi:hypothetical protein